MTFGKLIEDMGKNLGVELVDEGGATVVEVDGSVIAIHAAGADLLLIHADIGEIPPENRDRVLAAAMEANFLYQGTGGATLAVDSRNGHLHMQKYNWLDRLDAEKAAEDIANFATSVNEGKKIVVDLRGGASSESADSSEQSPGGFMRV